MPRCARPGQTVTGPRSAGGGGGRQRHWDGRPTFWVQTNSILLPQTKVNDEMLRFLAELKLKDAGRFYY